MANIFKQLFARNSDLNDFERWVVDIAADKLKPEVAHILYRRLTAVNKVSRLTNGREINLYTIRHGKPSFSDDWRYPDMREEAVLATVTVKHPANRQKLEAEVWIVEGFFSITFNKEPKPFFAGVDLKALPEDRVDVKVHYDPMLPQVLETEGTVDTSKLSGWVLDAYRAGTISDLKKQLPAAKRKAALGRLEAHFPEDYEELIAQTDGARIDAWKVHGPNAIRQVVLEDGSYYILAEADTPHVLAVKEGDHKSLIYRYDLETGERRIVGPSIRQACLASSGS
jgi:hypothetical protein